jgi:hypothetical protein
VRRIGEVVREQVALYGTLTGARVPATAKPPARPPQRPVTEPEPDTELAKILQLPAKRTQAR